MVAAQITLTDLPKGIDLQLASKSTRTPTYKLPFVLPNWLYLKLLMHTLRSNALCSGPEYIVPLKAPNLWL